MITRLIGRCAILLPALMAASICASAQGRLEIAGGGTYDWGEVEPGKLKAQVELRNVGDGNVNIIEVRPTCLCTVAPVDRNFLAPDSVAHVDITLDITNKTGPVERSILVRWIDSAAGGKADSSWIHLKAMAKREITISPAATLIVGSARIGEEARVLPLRIRNTSDVPITVFPPVINDGGNAILRFEMTEARELAPNEEFELRSYVTPFKVGSIVAQAVMKTTGRKMQQIVLATVGTVTAPPTPPQGTPAPPGSKP